MGFVTPSHFSRVSAFGLINRPVASVGENVRNALERARTEVRRAMGPYNREFPIDRLRRRLAHAMCLDVIFSPRLTKEWESSKWPNSRLPMYYRWEKTPVWKLAPRGALEKSRRISSLLHLIVTDGYKANIAHDLVRLAINIWRMPMRHFVGLCRLITMKIVKASRASYDQSPDPVLRLGTLSTSPIHPNRVKWPPSHKCHANRRGFGVTHLPKNLDSLAMMLGTRWYKTFVRQMVRSTRIKFREGTS
jgi:hypothetical protein